MRRLVLVLGAIAALVLWRRRARPDSRVVVVYDDGSALTLERGVEADDLLDDARELLAALA